MKLELNSKYLGIANLAVGVLDCLMYLVTNAWFPGVMGVANIACGLFLINKTQ